MWNSTVGPPFDTPTQTYSSASAPLKATKIAMVKVSDVEVVRVGSELLRSIYTFSVFWRFFVPGRDAKWLRAELTLAQSTGRRWCHLACSMDIILSKSFATRPKLPGSDTSTATGRNRVIRLVYHK